MRPSSTTLFLPISLLLSSVLLLAPITTLAHPYKDYLADWNININQEAGDNVLEYSSERGAGRNATYTPSPDNWRALPFYNLLLDKWAVSNTPFFHAFERLRGGKKEGEESEERLGPDLAISFCLFSFLPCRTETRPTTTTTRPYSRLTLPRSTSATEETSKDS